MVSFTSNDKPHATFGTEPGGAGDAAATSLLPSRSRPRWPTLPPLRSRHSQIWRSSPERDLNIGYLRRAIRKMNRHDVPGKPCTRLTLHQASLLIGDPMSGPRVALADTKDAIA